MKQLAPFMSALLSVYTLTVSAGTAVVGGDQPYLTYHFSDQDIEIIFTEQNKYVAETVLITEPLIQRDYEETFGYRLDSTLHVGLISDQNQIANGFSTQIPLNMQINYIGGAQYPDEFTANSWLKELLYHETAHNYQVNPKASPVTRALHSVFGNGIVSLSIFPILTTPNNALSSFLLEGNAVLNESWHNNGGRLYNGRYLAASILQAQAGHITPAFLFNQEINAFPYYDRHYIIGGFFQLYLGQKYGIKEVNSFFYNHSKSWLWPYRTNHIFEMTFGQRFEKELAQYNQWLLDKSNDFVVASGKQIATSQSFSSLNSDENEIFYLTTDAQRAPELVTLNKATHEIDKVRESYLKSKLIKVDNQYYTQASNAIDPTFIAQGLFDENANIKEGTEGKLIQGYIQGRPIYFDVPSSFEKPQLYVNDEFYAEVNSSVFIDSADNLYYFVQKNKTRTLYKNKTAILSLNDYYGFVSDVDEQGRILFIANSENGSSLYRFDNAMNQIDRLVAGDNIVEAKLINHDEVLLATINKRNYQYIIAPITATPETPVPRNFFFENHDNFNPIKIAKNSDAKEATHSEDEAINTESSKSKGHLMEQFVDHSEDYNALSNLHYSGTDFSFSTMNSTEGVNVNYSISMNFIDPLLTNAFAIFAHKDEGESGVAGLSYNNSVFYMPFEMKVYGVYDESDASEYYAYHPLINTYASSPVAIAQSSRDYGAMLSTSLPVYKTGYNYAGFKASYYQDPDNNQRSPAILELNIAHSERYGKAVDYYYNHRLKTFLAEDRSDISTGFRYKVSHGLPWESFAGIGLTGIHSNFERTTLGAESATRGVKFSPYGSSITSDPATIVMPSLHHTRFVKQGGVAELDLKKQFDYQALFFTFPFSLTQETFYAKQRHYRIEDYLLNSTKTQTINYNETTLGISLDILILNTLTVPVHFSYILNDNTHDKSQFKFTVGDDF